MANPMGGVVVNGQASFTSVGNTLTITNTPGTIINWQDFSIGANETTRFIQQSASSAVLNRVVTQNPSQIFGALQSNGRVVLINPNGIVFGASASVDVPGLVASTLALSDADFLAGRYHFTQAPGAGNVSNAGTIEAQQGGQIYLVAPDVENSGVITAPDGDILLVAGHSVELVDSDDPNLRVSITAPAGEATNVGQLIASAGKLGLFGSMVRNSGGVSADSATMQGGKIVLRSSQRTEAGGTISASGKGGGEIAILSDMQSGTVSLTGMLDASASGSGDGGFVDTSAAHVQIADTVRVNTLAANGKHGTWLIDPTDFFISATNPSGGVSWMSNGTLASNLGLGNVTIQTLTEGTGNGDIFVQGNVNWDSANSLTLSASRNIDVAAAITNAGSGSINLNANGLVRIAQNLQTAGAINVTTTGNINQVSGIISNSLVGGATGTNDITFSGDDITLAQVQSQRHVVLNASGGVNLLAQGSGGYIDDTFFVYNLPFAFNYFGTSYTQAYITTNGLIMFGSGVTSYSDSLSGLGGLKAIAPAWNDWIIQANAGKDIRIGFGSNDVKIRYDVARWSNESATAQFEAVLNTNGAITFNYGAANTSFANDVTIGISDGSGTAIPSQLMNRSNFSMNNLASTTFTPNAVGGYTETVSTTNSPLSPQGPVSGSALLGQGSGQVVNALGRLTINAGGNINAPSDLFAQELNFASHGGAMFTGNNQFSHISSGVNNASGNLVIYNTGEPLMIGALSNSGGNIAVDNTGGINVAGAVSASGNLDMTAHSPITIGSTASLLAGGNINLAAVSAGAESVLDMLSIAGNIVSTSGSIVLNGGSGVIFAPTANVSSSLGGISATSAFGLVDVNEGATLSAPTISLTSYAATTHPIQINVPPLETEPGPEPEPEPEPKPHADSVPPAVNNAIVFASALPVFDAAQSSGAAQSSDTENADSRGRNAQSVAETGEMSAAEGSTTNTLPVCN